MLQDVEILTGNNLICQFEVLNSHERKSIKNLTLNVNLKFKPDHIFNKIAERGS